MIFEAFLPVFPFLAGDSCSYTMAQLAAIPGTTREELFQNNSTCGHPYRVTTLLYKRMKRAHADVPELAFNELAPMKIMTLQLALRYSCWAASSARNTGERLGRTIQAETSALAASLVFRGSPDRSMGGFYMWIHPYIAQRVLGPILFSFFCSRLGSPCWELLQKRCSWIPQWLARLHPPRNGFTISRHGYLTSLLFRGVCWLHGAVTACWRRELWVASSELKQYVLSFRQGSLSAVFTHFFPPKHTASGGGGEQLVLRRWRLKHYQVYHVFRSRSKTHQARWKTANDLKSPWIRPLKPSSSNSARQHMCSWSLSRSCALGDPVQSSASRLRRPPSEMAEGLFSPCLLHAQLCLQTCISCGAPCSCSWAPEPPRAALGELQRHRISWVVLEAIKLLFVRPNVEEVRAGIFNPLEMIRGEEHKGGLDERFAPKRCGS